MKIPVHLNGTKTILDAQPDDLLIKVLHKNGCISVKSGCKKGICGSCTVLLNDKPVASCKIPVGLIKDNEIVSLEYFSKSEEYVSIMDGFVKAGIKLCGYCNAGKVFSAYQILKMDKKPSRKEIADEIRHLAPCCTDMETLINGILYAIEIDNRKATRVSKKVRTKETASKVKK